VSTLFSGSTIFACTAIIALAKPLTADLNLPAPFLLAGGGSHCDTSFSAAAPFLPAQRSLRSPNRSRPTYQSL
jgi:hypothetical protein